MEILAAGLALLIASCAGFYAAHSPGWLDQGIGIDSAFYLVSLAIGLLCLIGILTYLEFGLLLLVVLLYTNASEVAVSHFSIPSPLQMIALATAAGVAARLLPDCSGHRGRLVLDPILLLLALYAAVIFASSIASANVQLADESLAEQLKAILVFFVVTNLVTSRATLKRLIWAIIVSGAILATISTYQVLTNSYSLDFAGFGRVKVAQIVGQTREPRIAGPLSDPNFYAQILVAVIPLALYRLWDESALSRKLLAGYALAVTTLAAIFTYSRGGAIGLGFVLLLALLHKRIQAKYLLLGAVVLAPLAFMLPQGFERRLITLEQLATVSGEGPAGDEDSSIRGRRLMMAAAWQMFVDHPLLGVGAGNYSEHFAEYSSHIGTTHSSYDNFGKQRYAHSLYLQVAAETGLAGITLFLTTIAASLFSLWTAYRSLIRIGAQQTANVVASLGLALTAYLITSLLLHGHYVRYLWLLVAVCASARQVAGRTAAESGIA